MNILIFFAIWAIVWYIPVPPAKFRLTSFRRLCTLGLGLFLFGINTLANTPLSLFVYFLVFSRSLVAIAEFFLPHTPFRLDQIEKGFQSGEFHQLQINLNRRRNLLAVTLIAIFIFSIAGMAVFAEVQRVANAAYFNGFIKESSGLPFSTTIPDNMVRLVTQELAISIARRHMSEFGSNTQILDCHVTKSPEGRLVWIATIGSTNIIAENYIKGFVIVDANNPAATPKIIRSEFNIGKGLWLDKNIPFRNYIADISKNYGVAYLTWDQDINNPAYVVTRYETGFDLIKRYAAPLAYGGEGQPKIEPNNRDEIPKWMTQIYDEDWLENMINEMGRFRRANAFDYFAGGFLWIIAPSRDRFEMTEDTRYVVDPETDDLVALICVNPVENRRTLSAVFKATREGIFYHDFKTANYISGMTAEDLVEGRLPKPATGNYYAVMPLLYGVEVTPSNFRLAWYVPIYWYEDTYEGDETIYLAGFAIVDAQDTNKIVTTINQAGITSEQMVCQTRLEFTRLFGGNETTHTEVKANVINAYEYVQNGMTHRVLRLDSTTHPWIEGTPENLSANEWNQLMTAQPGQAIVAWVEKREDRWIITRFGS